jgi:hypothetical protein
MSCPNLASFNVKNRTEGIVNNEVLLSVSVGHKLDVVSPEYSLESGKVHLSPSMS